MTGEKVITLDNMNSQIKKMEYAVRGPLVIRATAIEKELEAVSWFCQTVAFKVYIYVNFKLLF